MPAARPLALDAVQRAPASSAASAPRTDAAPSRPSAHAGTRSSSGKRTAAAGVDDHRDRRRGTGSRSRRPRATGTSAHASSRRGTAPTPQRPGPRPGVRIHRCATNFGQPWCMFAVQQPKFGSRPYRFDSGPLVVQPWSGLIVHCTWLTCWSYWCDHMSGENVAGSALKATRSRRSAKDGSPNTENRCSSEYMNSTTAQSSVPWSGFLPGQALVAGEHARAPGRGAGRGTRSSPWRTRGPRAADRAASSAPTPWSPCRC